MKKSYQFLLALGVAAASLSSCSRANYAVNTTAAPTSESMQIAAPASDAAASGTASVLATMPTEVLAPAREAAAALAHHASPAEAKTVKTAAAVASPAEAAISKVVTKAERKALRQEVKRQLASVPKSTSDEGKSQLVAALLCFFLGGLGVHDFYLGYIGKGILQIVLSILIVGFILVIIDLIRILTGSLKPKGGEYAKKI